MADWTDENKAQLIEEYKKEEPTAETSSEIVAELAPKYDATPNGVRMILVRAGVYIAKAKAKTSTDSSKEKKETKKESLDRLTSIIEAQALTADDTVISKLTGKAAAYFADIIRDATNEDTEKEG